ncbi:MAG: hypothetical protein WCH00_02430 [Candidatus Saccharibacteria bacterium]
MNDDIVTKTHQANDMAQLDNCKDCGKSPCVCSDKNQASEKLVKKVKRPKISWI